MSNLKVTNLQSLSSIHQCAETQCLLLTTHHPRTSWSAPKTSPLLLEEVIVVETLPNTELSSMENLTEVKLSSADVASWLAMAKDSMHRNTLTKRDTTFSRSKTSTPFNLLQQLVVKSLPTTPPLLTPQDLESTSGHTTVIPSSLKPSTRRIVASSRSSSCSSPKRNKRTKT